MLRNFLIIAFIVCAFPIHAQQTKSSLTTEINSNFSDQAVGSITPAKLRQVTTDMVNSWQQFASVNAQTGTTYTFTIIDYGKLITLNNAGGVNVTLPQATGAFATFNIFVSNIGTGTATITPTISTINNASSFTLAAGQSVWIVSDGTNYQTFSGGTLAPISSVAIGTPVTSSTNGYLFYSNGGNLGQEQYATLGQGGLGGSQAAATIGQVPIFPGSAGAAVPGSLGSIAGTATAAQMGGSAASHAVPVDVAGTPTWKVVPNCLDSAGQHLNYTQSTDAWSCGNTATSNILTSSQFGGVPWADIKSGANGCAAAVGNNSTDDTAAIQCQITYMETTYGGGRVFVSAGHYKTTSTITVPAGIMLTGSGLSVSLIDGGGSDFTVLHFTGNWAGIEKMSVYGYQNTAATTPTITIDAVIRSIIRDSNIWGGSYAMQTAGIDGYFVDTFFQGFGTSGGAVYSHGGVNWYTRVLFDDPGTAVAHGILIDQGALVGIMENHFVQCDFSGNYGTSSVSIADGTSTTAVTVFAGSVFSKPIILTTQKFTSFTGDELGANITLSAGAASVVGSVGLSAVTATGASCAGNVGITC